LVRSGHGDAHLVAWLDARGFGNNHRTIDLWRVPDAAGNSGAGLGAYVVDQHLDGAPHLGREPRRRDTLSNLHQALVALALEFGGDGTVDRVGGGSAHRFVLEASGPVDLGFLDPVE